MFKLQLPGNRADSLLETLLVECTEATGGGGVFAWATSAGARAFLRDETFQHFLDEAPFSLTVGLDSITNPAALSAITGEAGLRPNLTASAIVNPYPGSLFHPKMSWFDHKDHLSLIVGSGNLTIGGLSSNWEAYSVERLVGSAADDAWRAIQRLDETLTPLRKGLDDPEVETLAKANAGAEVALRGKRAPALTQPSPTTAESVLVCVLTRSSSRWGQSNFPRRILEGFFNARINTESRVLLARVDQNGHVHETVSRPAVSVKSQNYRLELDAPSILYLKGQRFVGIFIKIRDGRYLYSILLPGDSGHLEALTWLDFNHSGRELPRQVVSFTEAKAAVPSATIWSVELPLD